MNWSPIVWRYSSGAPGGYDSVSEYVREAQADAYIRGLFEAFGGIATGAVASRLTPAEFEVNGYVFRYRRHFVYWTPLGDGTIDIVTVLHERTHRIGRFLEDYEP